MTRISQGVGDICDFNEYPNGLVCYIDRICTDACGMMCSVQAGAIGNYGGALNVKKGNLSNFSMFMTGLVYYIGQASDEVKIAIPTRRRGRHNTDCHMTCFFLILATGNKQGAGEICDVSTFVDGVVCPIDLASDVKIANLTTLVERICAGGRRMMCSSLALVIGNTQSACDVEYSYISEFTMLANSLVSYIDLACEEERIASATLYMSTATTRMAAA